MSEQRTEDDLTAHDVLAAEAFAMPSPDPSLHDAEAHDVLAAEAFAVPAPDPTIHHAAVVLPGDLTGAEEPRDVLAAEEFAMPAGPPHPIGRAIGDTPGGWAGRAVLAAIGLLLARRLLGRR